MKTPKTPVEFDYDLWTTEDGKCMVRVKATGEVCEVDRDTMRLLRSEEKRIRREMEGVPVPGTSGTSDAEKASVLSLDVCLVDTDGIGQMWTEDPADMEGEAIFRMTLEEFVATLTDRQRDIYEKCICEGMKLREYSRLNNISLYAVRDSLKYIRKKFEKIF